MERIASVDGLFHEGNPAIGQKGTKVAAAWLNALQDVVIGVGGDIQTKDAEYTLVESDGVLFANPAEGAIINYHLPVYASVGALKRYKVKNIGQGIARLDAADGRTIDGDVTVDFNPGDRGELAKDGTNWQTL